MNPQQIRKIKKYGKKLLSLCVGEPLSPHKTSGNGHWDSCKAGEIQDKCRRAYRKKILDVLGDDANDWIFITRTLEDSTPNRFSWLEKTRQEILQHTHPDKKQVNWLEPQGGNLNPNKYLRSLIEQLANELLQVERDINEVKRETESQEKGEQVMDNNTKKGFIHQIAIKVQRLLTDYPIAKECFVKQLKVYKGYWKKYRKSPDDELPPIIEEKPEKSKKGLYEYDRKFKCYVLKDQTRLEPDPTQWEQDDKYPSYYAYLAVIYDLEKDGDAPFKLCEGILDKVAVWYIKHYLYDVWLYKDVWWYKNVVERLNMAFDFVEADIKERQGRAEKDENWHNDDFTEVRWNGKRYKFDKPQQALSVAYLWNNKRAREKSIGEAIGSEADNFRLIHIFRQSGKKAKMHPAWGTMIVADGKGIYALAESKKAQKK
jgi:hypothetical protein